MASRDLFTALAILEEHARREVAAHGFSLPRAIREDFGDAFVSKPDDPPANATPDAIGDYIAGNLDGRARLAACFAKAQASAGQRWAISYLAPTAEHPVRVVLTIAFVEFTSDETFDTVWTRRPLLLATDRDRPELVELQEPQPSTLN